MIKKLVKTGSSYALIIDKSIMELLNITPDTPLEIKTDGKSLKITPASVSFDNAMEQSFKEHHNVYKRLA